MFKSIGCKFLDPNYRDDDDSKGGAGSQASSGTTGGIKLDAKKVTEESQKKGCCK